MKTRSLQLKPQTQQSFLPQIHRLGKKGFALITTLTILVLLALVATGFLTLAAVESRRSSVADAQEEARSNAKLALNIAIGELQKHLGTDRAISAPAGIGQFSESDLNIGIRPASSKEFLKSYTGAWAAAENPRPANADDSFIHNTPVYRENGTFTGKTLNNEDIFKRWLVSNITTTELETENFFSNATDSQSPFTDPVALVSSGTVSDSNRFIYAGKIPISSISNGSDKSRGKYAWWINGNNTKAFLRPRDLKSRDTDEILASDHLIRSGTPGAFGLESLTSLGIPANSPDTDKLISLGQVDLISSEDNDITKDYYHDLTHLADSLLTNVTAGGTRKDLSLYFERDTPFSGKWDGLIRDGDAPTGPYGKYALSEIDDYDTAAWSSLREHYWLYRNTDDSLLKKTDSKGVTIRAVDGQVGSNANSPHYPAWNTQRKRLSPVVTRFSLAYSIGVHDIGQPGTLHPNIRDNIDNIRPRNRTPDPKTYRYNLNFHAYPVLTVWNPYNVPMEVPGFVVNATGSSVSHDILISGSQPMHYNWNDYRSASLSETDPTASGDSASHALGMINSTKFTLSPGESRTFFGTQDIDNRRFNLYTVAKSAKNANGVEFEPDQSNTFSAGIVRNGITSSTAHGDSSTGNFSAYAGILGLFASASDTVTINSRIFSPSGEVSKDANNDISDGLQGLIYYGTYHSIGLNFSTATFPTGSLASQVNAADIYYGAGQGAGRNKDSARYSSIVAWRNDPGNPVVIRDAALLADQTINVGDLIGGRKIPYLLIDLRLKSTEAAGTDEDANANITWLHNIPAHGFAGMTSLGTQKSIGQSIPDSDIATAAHARAYTLRYFPVSGVNDLLSQLALDRVGSRLTGYFGNSYSSDGQHRVIANEIPLAPLQSIAQFQHVPMTPIDGTRVSGLGVQNYAIGGSYASPLIESDKIRFPDKHWGNNPKSTSWEGWKVWTSWHLDSPLINQRPDLENVAWHGDNSYTESFKPIKLVDRSYVANTLLWDDFFFSGFANYSGRLYSRLKGESYSKDEVVKRFAEGTDILPNTRYRLNLNGSDNDAITTKLQDDDGYLHAASHMTVEGGFNVHSLSVQAWKVFLASNLKKRLPILSSTGSPKTLSNFPTSTLDSSTGDGEYIINRTSIGVEQLSSVDEERVRWATHNTISSSDLDDLALKIVAEVSARGPFRSIGEFVNRRVEDGNSELSVKGALQAALDKSSVNSDLATDTISSLEIAGTSYKNDEAAKQSRHAGTPEYVLQSDLLQSIGALVQVRSDSFTVRAYGESADGSSKAWCEAQVVRTINYVDSTDDPELSEDKLQSDTNKEFGRRFKIVSFRWVPANEV